MYKSTLVQLEFNARLEKSPAHLPNLYPSTCSAIVNKSKQLHFKFFYP